MQKCKCSFFRKHKVHGLQNFILNTITSTFGNVREKELIRGISPKYVVMKLLSSGQQTYRTVRYV